MFVKAQKSEGLVLIWFSRRVKLALRIWIVCIQREARRAQIEIEKARCL